MENKTEKISVETMVQALNYVGEFINSLSLAGYESHKRAVECMDNIKIVIQQLQTEDKDGMD